MTFSFYPQANTLQNVTARTKAARERSLASSKSDVVGNRVVMEEYLYLNLPEQDKSLAVQIDTALLFVTAGFETTAFTIEQAVFHLHDQPTLLSKLHEELVIAIPDSHLIPPWSELEKLPYLSAIIQESLRMSLGAMSRLPRTNTKHDLHYKSWTIPKNTYVGMSAQFTNYNADIFPDPYTFVPERWLQSVDESKRLDRYMVSFSKGSRRCIGIHLAYAELYITLATIFRRFRFELYETTRRDVDPKIDYFAPKPEHGSLGVRLPVR